MLVFLKLVLLVSIERFILSIGHGYRDYVRTTVVVITSYMFVRGSGSSYTYLDMDGI